MNSTLTPEITEVMGALPYRPAVSIIMPFETKINLHTELSHSLKVAVDKVEQEILRDYPGDIGKLAILKLKNLIKNLTIDTNKKSVAIYVSPLFEKVIYLDVAVEEKIIIDESFEIRDLVYSKKQLQKYLVLLLSEKESEMYLCNTASSAKLVTASPPDSVYALINEAPEKVSNFSDMSKRKEIIMEKFLRHIDNTLDIVLNVYHVPLFVLGSERLLGHFKKFTKHTKAVTSYINGNYEGVTQSELSEILKPHIDSWKKLKQKEILDQLEEAANKKKLVVGIKDVWQEVANQKGRLLVVEKDFMYAAVHGSKEQAIYQADKPYNKFTYIRDAVDDAIEKVLEKGGEVEFVDNDALKDYLHIALIQYH